MARQPDPGARACVRVLLVVVVGREGGRGVAFGLGGGGRLFLMSGDWMGGM